MNHVPDETQRSPADLIVFALIFCGAIFSAAGVATTTVPVLVMGVLLIAMGLGYFLILGE